MAAVTLGCFLDVTCLCVQVCMCVDASNFGWSLCQPFVVLVECL